MRTEIERIPQSEQRRESTTLHKHMDATGTLLTRDPECAKADRHMERNVRQPACGLAARSALPRPVLVKVQTENSRSLQIVIVRVVMERAALARAAVGSAVSDERLATRKPNITE